MLTVSYDIKMLRTVKGSNNGIHVREYFEGQIYNVPQDVSHSLCKTFLDNRWATKTMPTMQTKNNKKKK